MEKNKHLKRSNEDQNQSMEYLPRTQLILCKEAILDLMMLSKEEQPKPTRTDQTTDAYG